MPLSSRYADSRNELTNAVAPTDYPAMMEPDEIKSLTASIASYSLQQSQQSQQLQQTRSHPLFIQHQHQQNQQQSQQQNQQQNQQQHLSQYQQLLAAQQSTPPPPPRQYTTVGSLYNPQSQPLQPPVRRGRTVKSLFPYKSESPSGPSQLQYTPLQQNSDRAVSPARPDIEPLSSILATTTVQERQDLQRFDVTNSHFHQDPRMSSPMWSPTANNDGTARQISNRLVNGMGSVADPIIDDNSVLRANTRTNSDHVNDKAEAKLFAMNFNSLTNLASYPNPMQRPAQKVLASHRPHPAAAIDVSSSYEGNRSI